MMKNNKNITINDPFYESHKRQNLAALTLKL